ncbi:MAG: phosphoglycerate mutase family protein [Daejeonella sp.]
MKNLRLSLLLVLIGISCISATHTVKETVIYIVRHGEKDTTDAKNTDPELSAEGKERAQALAKVLKREKLAAVYSTPYKRTQQTVVPCAQRNGIPLKTYGNKEVQNMVETINSQFAHQKVLIAGHSNSVLELIESFGGKRPVEKLNDDDYDFIFKLTLTKDGLVKVKTMRYGKTHHSTEVDLN